MTHKNNVIGIIMVTLILTGSILIFNNSENMLTGYSVYDPDAPICHVGLNSCIDLDGDGEVYSGSNDELIFSCLIDGNSPGCPDVTINENWTSLFGYNKSHFENLADFDGVSGVSQLIDFQRCYVPMRDRAIDDGSANNITCNLPAEEFNEEICKFGCPDLNGDGYVDENDLSILTNISVWMNDSFYDRYPMADMNNDSTVDWEDRNCMTLYANEYALCNMPTYFKHNDSSVCPDFANITTDLELVFYSVWQFLLIHLLLFPLPC